MCIFEATFKSCSHRRDNDISARYIRFPGIKKQECISHSKLWPLDALHSENCARQNQCANVCQMPIIIYTSIQMPLLPKIPINLLIFFEFERRRRERFLQDIQSKICISRVRFSIKKKQANLAHQCFTYINKCASIMFMRVFLSTCVFQTRTPNFF